MKALGYALAALACWLLHLASRTLTIAARFVLLLVLPLAARFVRARQRASQGLAVPLRNQRLHVDEVATAASAGERGTSNAATYGNPSHLAVADRIVSLRLDPPVGVIHLRVYQARRVVRRELIVLEPCLRALLKGRRHPLPEVAYDPVDGLEAIKNQAVEAAESWINARGNAGRQRPPRPANRRADPPSPPAAAGANERPLAPPPAATAAPIPAPAATTVAPTAGTGYRYVGTLVKAGTATVTPEGRPPYDIFEATLQLDNGAELALRGAELQRELAACRCTVGQRIAITPMGKVPVALANGTAGQKNLYRVQLAGPLPAQATP